jgi:hypothetical protein
LRFLFPLGHRARHGLQGGNCRLRAPVEPALQIDRTGASHDLADAVGKDRVCENGRGTGAITDQIARLLGGLPQHLRTEVFLRVLDVEFLGNCDAVIANDRCSARFLNEDGFGFWPQRDPDRISQ